MLQDPKTGILYREKTFDEYILRESKGYFPLGLKDDDSILDLGGHIGCFSSRSILEKDVPVYAIEAERSNCDMLIKNATKFNFDAKYGAIVEDSLHGQVIPLYVNELKNNALHSTIPVRGRAEQHTVGIGFRKILSYVSPTIIKCDIEGAEYELPWECLAGEKLVRKVIMELHMTKTGHRLKASVMIDRMQKIGFTITRYPIIGEKNWATLAVWERL
jgi:hypothetical protein